MEALNHYQQCIDACLKCASACNYCASACTREEHVKMMANCICLDMQCAAICYATAELMSLDSDYAMGICGICADVCEACANECSKHFTDHCRACAEACTECARACRSLMAA